MQEQEQRVNHSHTYRFKTNDFSSTLLAVILLFYTIIIITHGLRGRDPLVSPLHGRGTPYDHFFFSRLQWRS